MRGVAPERVRSASATSAEKPKAPATIAMTSVAATAHAAATPTARPSKARSSVSMSTPPGNWYARSAATSQPASGIASAAPPAASIAPSHATPRASLARDAPSARHIANSPRRASVRTSSSMPTVAHPISSSRPTVMPSSRVNCAIPARAAAGTAAVLTSVNPYCGGTRSRGSGGSAAICAAVRSAVDAAASRPTIVIQLNGELA